MLPRGRGGCECGMASPAAGKTCFPLRGGARTGRCPRLGRGKDETAGGTAARLYPHRFCRPRRHEGRRPRKAYPRVHGAFRHFKALPGRHDQPLSVVRCRRPFRGLGKEDLSQGARRHRRRIAVGTDPALRPCGRERPAHRLDVAQPQPARQVRQAQFLRLCRPRIQERQRHPPESGAHRTGAVHFGQEKHGRRRSF